MVRASEISILSFDLGGHHRFLHGLIECYRNVFADVPWNEWKRCPVCKEYWGKKDENKLRLMDFSHCGVPLENYWEHGVVEDDIRRAISMEASFFIATHNNNVIGFCWGYPVEPIKLEEELGVGIIAQLEELWRCPHLVAYQKDLGIDIRFRGLKIAKKMFVARYFDFLKKGLSIGVARTRKLPEPSQTYLWFKNKMGYKTIASYPVLDGRVILAQKLDSPEFSNYL